MRNEIWHRVERICALFNCPFFTREAANVQLLFLTSSVKKSEKKICLSYIPYLFAQPRISAKKTEVHKEEVAQESSLIDLNDNEIQ